MRAHHLALLIWCPGSASIMFAMNAANEAKTLRMQSDIMQLPEPDNAVVVQVVRRDESSRAPTRAVRNCAAWRPWRSVSRVCEHGRGDSTESDGARRGSA